MSVLSRKSGDTTILEPSGRLSEAAVEEFRSKWTEALGGDGVHNIVVNLGRVTRELHLTEGKPGGLAQTVYEVSIH